MDLPKRRVLGFASAAVIVVVVGVLAGYGLGSGGDAARGGSPAPAPPTPAMAADEGAFWQVITDTRKASGNDTGKQSDLLEQRLGRPGGPRIADFRRVRRRLDEQAYTWKLWGAAYVIEDGCSDDCFRDFRSYLISLGRGPYEAALNDPDSLATVVQDRETGGWENAYSGADASDLAGDPSGKSWDDDSEDALVQRYPRLAARFR